MSIHNENSPITSENKSYTASDKTKTIDSDPQKKDKNIEIIIYRM